MIHMVSTQQILITISCKDRWISMQTLDSIKVFYYTLCNIPLFHALQNVAFFTAKNLYESPFLLLATCSGYIWMTLFSSVIVFFLFFLLQDWFFNLRGQFFSLVSLARLVCKQERLKWTTVIKWELCWGLELRLWGRECCEHCQADYRAV